MTEWSVLGEDAKEQARIAGVDPDDPAFRRYAGQAPRDRDFYDQVTWVIQKTRAEIEGRKKTALSPEALSPEVPIVTVDEALKVAMDGQRVQ